MVSQRYSGCRGSSFNSACTIASASGLRFFQDLVLKVLQVINTSAGNLLANRLFSMGFDIVVSAGRVLRVVGSTESNIPTAASITAAKSKNPRPISRLLVLIGKRSWCDPWEKRGHP